MTRTLLLSLALILMMGCQQTSEQGESPAKPLASIASKRLAMPAAEPAKAAKAEATAIANPRSEEALIEAVAKALSARDLSSLRASATPEFAADLQRMHDAQPSSFWIRGSAFVQNVKSGFEVLHRQEDTSDQWHIVVRFGNGHEERMTFTREGGKLRFVDL